MKLSEQWLREWVNPAVSIQEIGQQLTMAGIEVDAIEPVAGAFSHVIIGEIIAAERHENAEKLQVCRVNIGQTEALQIVCGAANARVGLKVPVAVIGAVLPNGLTIKAAKLRGIASQGMICSSTELGLAEISEGILELSSDAPIGTNFREWLQLNDVTLELSVTPNRGDCLSILGTAREIAVLNQQTLQQPIRHTAEITAADALFPVHIIASEDCPRYIGRVIKQLNPMAKTPLWLQERLRRSGIKSISAIVDVTNYVLLELGQPMHAFDLAKLHGGITVRRAQPAETLTLLDQQTVNLHEHTLLIADDKGPLAIAGVMGGLDSAVTEATCDIFLESAYFNPLTIAGKARLYGVQTDSAHRFERGVDPTLQTYAIERATELLYEIAGGTVGPLIEIVQQQYLPTQAVITLRRKRIEQLLGFVMEDDEIVSILNRLGMQLTQQAEGWQVIAPIHRFDIALEVDLIEELARIKGYENIPVHFPKLPQKLQPASEKSLALTRLRTLLANKGYREAITYSFVDPKLQQLILPQQSALTLINPMSQDMSVMRMGLWPGLLNALIYNQNRQQSRVRLYETGLCFNSEGTTIIQEMRLGGIIAGSVYPEQWATQQQTVDFFDVKADLEALFQLSLASANYHFVASAHPALHPGQSAAIYKQDKPIGYLGKLHPELEQKLALAGPVYLFELSLAEVLTAELPNYQALSKFPAIRRDLAIVVEQHVTAQAIQTCIRAAANEWLKHIQVFDVYQGKGIPEGYKSLAIGLTLQHDTRTLVEQEVAELITHIMQQLTKEYKASLRD